MQGEGLGIIGPAAMLRSMQGEELGIIVSAAMLRSLQGEGLGITGLVGQQCGGM